MIRLIPNAFDPALVRAAARAWPEPAWDGWFAYPDSGKRVCSDWAAIPSACAMLLNHLLAYPARAMVDRQDLVPDGSLWGGGMHSMSAGAGLGLHLDSDHNTRHGWRRAVNAILYLNEGWLPEWGGAFELWDEGMHGPIARVAPVFNSLLVFATGDDAPHAVGPVTCPTGEQRMSLAVFWVGGANKRGRAEFIHSL